mgnify:CR=1 FL=1
MRILYSHRTRSADGQSVHIEALTQALSALGHDILICGPEGVRKAGSPPGRPAVAKGAAVRMPSSSAWPLGLKEGAEGAYSLLGALRLYRAAKRFRPDIIYERYNLYYHAGVWVSRMTKLPLLMEVNAPLAEERARHGDLSWRSVAHWSEGRLWRGADAVLPVSGVLQDTVMAKGVPSDRIHIVPNGVDDAALVPADPTSVIDQYGLEGRLVLGFVGFVREWHGVDRVLDWMATPKGAISTLLLVGDGPAAAVLRAKAHQLGISDKVIMTGTIPHAEIANHIAAFDVALQPAATPYASPLKLQEYMAQGRAILAPRQPNILETLSHGRTGWLFDPEADGALAAGLDALSSDADRRRQLGAAARDHLVAQDLTWAANARKVMSIAQTLLTPVNKGS